MAGLRISRFLRQITKGNQDGAKNEKKSEVKKRDAKTSHEEMSRDAKKGKQTMDGKHRLVATGPLERKGRHEAPRPLQDAPTPPHDAPRSPQDAQR